MKKRLLERLEALRSVEHGFTLMELLVAMVVLSILMATASQYYLQHRRKAWEAQVRASVRNMAGAQNHFVYTEGGSTFTHDLDDLYFTGYRWNDRSLRPYVALATTQTFCIQVSSANDPSIVWHFSSDIGHPQPGPATPTDCGDPEVLGLYIAGLPSEDVGRDGQLSGGGVGTGEWVASLPPGSSSSSSPDGESSIEEGEFGPGGSGTGTGDPGTGGSGTGTGDTGSGGTGTGTGEGGTTTGSTPGYGTTDPTSGTVPGDTTGGSSGGTTGGTTGGGSSTEGCSGGGTGSGSTTGNNHPSGKDRSSEDDGSGSQGSSGSDPDGDENGGADKPGEDGGANTGDQDGNNGSGNDTDFEDDNRGPDRDGTPTPGSTC